MSLGIASIWRIALQKAIITHNIHVSSYFSMRCHVLHRVSQEEKAFSGLTLGMISGALVSMPLTGRLIGHYGSDRMARIAVLGFPVTLIGIALAPGFGWLIVAAIGFGVWKGMLDVSVNAQAITVENAMERPVMGGYQGCWSLGGVSAAALLSALM